MTDEPTAPAAPSSSRTFALQVLVVAIALVVATYVLVAPAATPSPSFNMLTYLDMRVATQEDVKDVRCWSSFCKLQMFITGAAFEEEVKGVRIEKHMDLIQSIWDEARRADPDAEFIRQESVAAVLERRFPHQLDETEGATFALAEQLPQIRIDADSLQDYSDTIEPWRLMQTWATRHADASGQLNLQPQFDEQSLGEMYRFLRTYDLAVLKHARQIAEGKKLARIDADSMAEAFSLESRLRK